MRRPVPVHYLRPNEKVWTPPVVMFLDVETDQTDEGDRLVLRPNLWVTLLVERVRQRARPIEDVWAEGTTSDQLADHVDRTARRYRTTWLFAHNVSFDAAATGLPQRLVRRGWTITDFSVRGGSPWFRLRNDRHALTIVDSWSWLPQALGAIGTAVGQEKPDLPDFDGPAGEWAERCRADVAITAKAVLELMSWWDRHQLGRWVLTGAGCGWNAFRHIPHPQRILIDHDEEAIRFERRAIYGGRREAYAIGALPPGSYVDMDVKNAYPSAALHFPLPMKRAGMFTSLPLDHVWLRARTYGVLAEVTLNLKQPTVPVRVGGFVWYPTGRVRTVLASPELEPLLAAGAVESIGPGYAYRLGWTLKPWAAWVTSVANGEAEDSPPVARIAAKAWSRTVIGKFATRSHRVEPMGLAPVSGWALEEGRHHDLGVPVDVVDMAGRRYLIVRDQEGDNVFPAVTAFIESHVRAALTRAMESIPPWRVLQCDTDGFLLNETNVDPLRTLVREGINPKSRAAAMATEQDQDLHAAVAPFSLVRKATYTTVEIQGPQHLRLDNERRLSGIPRSAVESEPNRFKVHLWPKLQWQMAHGHAEGYVRPLVTQTVKGPYTHRWVLSDATTVPVVADLDQLGNTVLLPWSTTPAAQVGADLATQQHPVLAQLVDQVDESVATPARESDVQLQLPHADHA